MTMQELLDAIIPAHHPHPALNPARTFLDEKAEYHPELHWKTSIVDLLKLVDKDSSLPAREKLAKELGYPGKPGTGESTMNEFLHRKVLERLGVKL
jgi:hypothetical protein